MCVGRWLTHTLALADTTIPVSSGVGGGGVNILGKKYKGVHFCFAIKDIIGIISKI